MAFTRGLFAIGLAGCAPTTGEPLAKAPQPALVQPAVEATPPTTAVTEPPPPAPAPLGPAPLGPAPLEPEVHEDPEAQWACDRDADCEQTCFLGAVSRTWIAAHPNADACDDGCGWNPGRVACRDRECVTLTPDGDIDASCTKRPSPGHR